MVKTGENEQRLIVMNKSDEDTAPASQPSCLSPADWQVITDIIDNPFLSLSEREQVLLQHGLMVIRV